MSSIERNSEDWREIRSRVDSIASAIFLISGGALSLSITVLLGNLDSDWITPKVASLSACSWYLLLAAVLLFLLLKVHLIYQAYMLQFNASFVDRHLKTFNRIGWAIGTLGFISFVVGLVSMVRAAAIAVGVH